MTILFYTIRKTFGAHELLKNQSLRILIIVSMLLIASLSCYFSNTPAKGSIVPSNMETTDNTTINQTSSETYDSTTMNLQQLFHCDILYAYVGKGSSTTQLRDFPKNTEYPLSQYPSAIYFNFTKIGIDNDDADAKFEVYLINIVTDKGLGEKYIWLEGTNINSSFSNLKQAQSITAHIDDLIDTRTTTGQGGHFKFNWTIGTSAVGGCTGSIGHYTNHPSKLGLWSAGQPDSIAVNISVIGWIILKGDCISTIPNNAVSNSFQQINLQRFENGFVHNEIISSSQLSLEKNLFNPAVGNLTDYTGMK